MDTEVSIILSTFYHIKHHKMDAHLGEASLSKSGWLSCVRTFRLEWVSWSWISANEHLYIATEDQKKMYKLGYLAYNKGLKLTGQGPRYSIKP